MTDFLLELRCEEIPARMQAGARADLEKLFRKELETAGVTPGQITVWSTPRRLALIARDLPEATEAVREETKGPRVGAPPQALEGFLRKSGLTQDRLEERDGVLFAVVEKPGRAVKVVLADAIPVIARAFPWPKSMRWGAASLTTDSPRWVRPLSGIVAIFGEDLVECSVGDVASGYMTLGHRFHHAGPITIGGAADYQEKLRACHVIVDHEERQNLIRSGAAKAAADAGLALIEDEGLVIENAGLTEWPVPLLGRFDEAFLEVPPEVIQLTARINQKYFVCEQGGKLANAFVCTANIEAKDGGAAIVDGNRKVLAARLSDARFFWQQDRKTPLVEQAKKLSRITFHEKLGTVADKVERVAKLAEWLAAEGIVPNCDPKLARQAAELCKADLVTDMVGEFPELQGLMGGYYARAEGLPDAVADAIRDHYKPVGQGDEVPTAPVTVAVSLADKLDTLGCFWAADEKPTGSKDPFALRRAALAVQSLILRNGLRLGLIPTLDKATQAGGVAMKAAQDAAVRRKMEALRADGIGSEAVMSMLGVGLKPFGAYSASFDVRAHDLLEFFADRLKVQQREAGVRHDLIDAVFALGSEDDLVRLLARVRALQSFVGTEDGTNLLAGYKRAANILKKEDWRGIEGEIARTGEEDPLALVDDPDLAPVIAAKMAERHGKELSYTPEPAEKALIDALDLAEPKASAAIDAEAFEGAMAALASLRAPIDRFFDEVTVNDENSDKRAARLDLLARFRGAVHNVADFSRIEG
ncbi:glycine--tRNA ligase subunit beta [Altererythrobacter sp. Root672]|uniref:glycine--tRNA ligase subunit beta n=1 Tax=Altererythrobacter sp. Root672 TaxID=1736584 RepID=UPI0006F8C3FB|nr:glycine--tRNA ligase subunit beta [Altererythrobacter sp. Root672]KRA84605.1 glycine--tRNA ligase subunit beta [Altererythrobacter sp. Root672]